MFTNGFSSSQLFRGIAAHLAAIRDVSGLGSSSRRLSGSETLTAAARLRGLPIWLISALLALAISLGQPVVEAAAPAAPGAVTNLTLKPAKTRITATWTAPNPAPTGRYIVEIFDEGSTTAFDEIKPKETKATFVALNPGESYTVSVKAQNKQGRSKTAGPAVTATMSTLSPPDAPGAVTNLSLTAGYRERSGRDGIHTITATWTAPNPAPTGKYVVGIFEGSSSDELYTISRESTSSKAHFDEGRLKPGTSYTVSVTAYNEDGGGKTAGSAVTATISTLSPPDPPGAVTNLSLKVTTDSVLASWRAPTPAPTGHYVARIFEADTGKGIAVIERARTEKRAFFDYSLKPGTSYTVSITAYNDNGGIKTAGPAVSATKSTRAVPGPVTNLALKASSNSLVATWTAPDPAPTGYLIKLFEGSSGTAMVKKQRGKGGVKARFNELTPNTSYRVSVTAQNKYKDIVIAGEAESATRSTLQASEGGRPGAPTNLMVLDATDKTATTYTLGLSWDAADSNGSDITHYIIYVTEFDASNQKVKSTRKQQASSKTTFSFANAKIGTRYVLEVRAKNGVGVGPWADAECNIE